MRHQLHRIDPERLRSDLRTLIKLSVPIIVLILVVVIASISAHLSVGMFTRDPATLSNSNPFFGVLSSVGVLFWAATAAICFFCAAIVGRMRADRGAARFLLGAGLITALLLLDDLFMFHEYVFPQFLHFGEKVTVLIYVAILAVFLWNNRQRLWRTDYVVLLVAFGLLGFSIVSDKFFDGSTENWGYLIEDGPKLFGIIAWFTYWSGVCTQMLSPRREG